MWSHTRTFKRNVLLNPLYITQYVNVARQRGIQALNRLYSTISIIMGLYQLYSHNVEIKYKSYFLSKASLFTFVTTFMNIVLPFIVAYRSRGNIVKHNTRVDISFLLQIFLNVLFFRILA